MGTIGDGEGAILATGWSAQSTRWIPAWWNGDLAGSSRIWQDLASQFPNSRNDTRNDME